MSTWYEKAVFYHMYPLGMTGALFRKTPGEQQADALSASPLGNPTADSHSDTDTAFAEQPTMENPFSQLNRWVPHLRELNVSAVYIGPLFESGSHGYDTRDYRRIDRRLGTSKDFRQFTALCHESGIRVVVDGVFNHTGRDFFAFRDLQENGEQSPYRDWYKGVWFGGSSPLGDSFSYESWRGIWELPCLNHQNPRVREYFLETVAFWVREFDIDGIRLDCANVLDFTFMRELRRLTDTLKPEFWLMGEVIHGDYARWISPEMLHSVTNYEMHKSIYSAHNDHNYFELAHNVRRLEAVGRTLYTFVDNHDENRIASKLQDKAHLFPVYTLLFTLPGIPSVYYGSEWGIEGLRSSTSDEALRPAISPDSLKERENDLSRLICRLGAIHRDDTALHGGAYKELYLTNRQYAFARLSPGHALITAANNDADKACFEVSLPLQTAEKQCADYLSGRLFAIENNKIQIELEGNSAVILRITEG